MKASKFLLVVTGLFVLLFATQTAAAQQPNPAPKPNINCPNFIDEDGDGLNDRMQAMHQNRNGQGMGKHGQGMMGKQGQGMMGNQGRGADGVCPIDGSGMGGGNPNGPGRGMHQGGMQPGDGSGIGSSCPNGPGRGNQGGMHGNRGGSR